MKKTKTNDEKSEGLSKLKALVSEPASKEIVVKTSKGTMTFQGISRKFTRKLYEWEKAKGIGPESSTFALLHPEYKAMLEKDKAEEGKREKSPGLKRCLSVDSVKPQPSHADIQISHQPSSLSLNDAEHFKENENNRRVSFNSALKTNLFNNLQTVLHLQVVSSFDIYQQSSKDNNETENDEPEAMLVEIEDDSFEIVQPVSAATPITQMQIPIFKFDFANRDSRFDKILNFRKFLMINLDLFLVTNLQIAFALSKKLLTCLRMPTTASWIFTKQTKFPSPALR